MRVAWNKGITNTWTKSDPNKWEVGHCLFCKKQLHTLKSRVANGRGKYCSMSCGAKARDSFRASMTLEARIKLSSYRGDKHWNWRGGNRNLQSRIRKLLVYRLWHTEILKRDNFRCQKCLQVGGRLEVDHKISFAELNVKLNIQSLEDAEKCKGLWRLDKDFAEALCKKCHKDKTKGDFHARAIVYGQPKHYSKSYLLRTSVA